MVTDLILLVSFSQALLRLRADAIENLGAEHADDIQTEFMKLDLESLQSVNDFVEAFKDKGYPLHFLICNAGIVNAPKGMNFD